MSEEDRAVIERAVVAAKRRNPALEESVFNFLRDILLFGFPENLDEEARAEHAHFVLKFQQSTGPIMAKGLEDTAFYIYNRLAALNEVGGEPQHFGVSVEDFHQRNLERQRDWPATLARHFDARHEAERRRARADGGDLGSAATLAQLAPALARDQSPLETKISTTPPRRTRTRNICSTRRCSAPGRSTPPAGAETTAGPEYIARLQAYMAKALKEAKVNTSWIQPNEQWDAAMHEFVARVLDPRPKNKFLPSFLPVAEEIARLGAINSLAQTLLKLTVPGVPDIYQGNEIWDFSLVDPDNRRPVDYKRRARNARRAERRRAGRVAAKLAGWADQSYS